MKALKFLTASSFFVLFPRFIKGCHSSWCWVDTSTSYLVTTQITCFQPCTSSFKIIADEEALNAVIISSNCFRFFPVLSRFSSIVLDSVWFPTIVYIVYFQTWMKRRLIVVLLNCPCLFAVLLFEVIIPVAILNNTLSSNLHFWRRRMATYL